MKNCISKLISDIKVFLQEQDISRTIVRLVAMVAIGLMLFGLLDTLRQPASFSLPGPASMSIGQIAHINATQTGLVTMSAGILLFVLLPSLRVLLGINQFVRHHETINLIAAIIVFIELTVGILLIFHVKGVLT